MKLGPHIIQPTSQAVDWASRAPIVKALDTPLPLTVAQPSTITDFRAFVQYQDTITPQEFLDLTIARLAGFRPTYIEGLNEHKAKQQYGLAEYIYWTKEFCRLAHIAGYQVAGFSFPTGNPESDGWFLLRDNNFGDVDVLSLHEYWGLQGLTIWNALRHRKVHEWLNGHHPPILITECGMDAVEGAVAGWKNNNITADEYLAQIIAFDAEIRKDPYVLGAAVFTAGATADWTNFEVDEIANQIPGSTLLAPSEETVPYKYVLGFESYANAHPEIGNPTSDLFYDAQGNALQYTEFGKLEWNKSSNQTLFFRSATR